MEYTVIVSVRGSVVLDIQAENINEAKRIAEEEVCNMDFNRLENIDWEVAGAWGKKYEVYPCLRNGL